MTLESLSVKNQKMIEFKKKIQSFTYLSPLEEFRPFEGKVEVRWDPLTKLTSRIVHFPKKKVEYTDVSSFAKMAPRETCPFCPENIGNMTSKFEPQLFGEERIREAGITVIPNILTFDKYCIVAVITQEHFLEMEGFLEKDSIGDGIKVLIPLLRKICEKDSKVNYLSINCNYMPMSGSSVLHPHIQAIAGQFATNYHRMIVEKSERFFNKNGRVYWDVLMEEESQIGERFLGKIGNTYWYLPFAPRGYIDVGCVFEKSSILDLDERDIKDLNEGFKRVIKYFLKEGVPGFNFSLFSCKVGMDRSFRANLRILARRFLLPLGASDTNYFHTLHMESTSIFSPEEVAEGIKQIWNQKGSG